MAKDHLYAYVYHEGEGKCGGKNNIASLVLETLRKKGLLNPNNPPLTFVFDNCLGQNKNGMVLKLVVYLVEMGYFEEVQCMFLIVGHYKESRQLTIQCTEITLSILEYLHNETVDWDG
jgi:hypothetical protein